MFVDDLVGAVPDDELVSASGVPRLDAEGLPVRRAQAYFDAARGVLMELAGGRSRRRSTGRATGSTRWESTWT